MKEELIIRVLSRASDFLSPEQVKQLRLILDEELYHYSVTSECTALTVTENMPGKVMLFLAAKKLDGMSINTIKNYHLILKRFCNVIHKDIEQITAMDIRMYLALRSKDGLKNSSLAASVAALKSFFSWLEAEDYQDNNTALFVGERFPHERLGRRAIEKAFTELGRKARINREVYPHLLRHTTATHMLQGGATLEEVQSYLGHDSPATTQIYTQVSTDAIKQSHLKHVI